MKLALAQIASTADRAANLQRALRAMDEAGEAGADLIAFPEVVLDRFFPVEKGAGGCREAAHALAEPVPGPTVEKLQAKARERGLVTVFNLYERAGERFYDSSPVIDSDGSLLGVTRMVHITDYEGFHEQDYYDPGDTGAPVYDTACGRVGVAICYDRHYPEYMRALAVAGADLVVIPQAGALGEWPEGLFEAEVRTAAFQNGYFAALCNRVGVEDKMTFAGESFVTDPSGHMLARGRTLEEDLVVADLDLATCAESPGRKLFMRDRRPGLYADWLSR
ncbi:MAG: carbon-nitrogen hydrolase family protein [Acidobacteriota bacterium]